MRERAIIKICGLRDEAMMAHSVDAGASYLGLVIHPASPRHVTIEKASALAAQFHEKAQIVVLVANPSRDRVAEIAERVRPHIIQFHGSESAAQIEDFRNSLPSSIKIWKAINIAQRGDIDSALPFISFVDLILFDAKPPKGAMRAGGHGISFDWSILSRLNETGGAEFAWILAGGLTPDNVLQAIDIAQHCKGFCGVDVSSGVEEAPGQKDPQRLSHFIHCARGAMKG